MELKMKRTKESDWTRILQERLLDAELPVDGVLPPTAPSFAGSTGEAPAERPSLWWPWALAGVAAILAAVLLLRPLADPVHESDRLAETSPAPIADLTDEAPATESSSGIDPELSEPADGVFQTGGPELFFGSRKTNSGSANPSADPTSPSYAGLTGESPSSNSALDEDGEAKIELPSSNPAPSEDGTPKTTTPSSKQAPNEDKISDQGLNDGWEFLDEPTRRSRRAKRGRVALRIHAATAGLSVSGSAQAGNLSEMMQIDGNWIPLDATNAKSLNSAFNNGTNHFTDSELPQQLKNVKWLYVQNNTQTVNEIAFVQQAPAIPVSFGVSLSFPLSRRWVLTAGLDYTQRDGYHVINDIPQSLTLHYLGIPVDALYYFNPENRWRFYLGAGLHAAKCIYAAGGQPLQDPVLFSGNLMAGTDIRLFSGVRLYLAPSLSGPFNRSAYVNSWDNKLQFQLRVGLSFDLK
jgi:hypothetical protein